MNLTDQEVREIYTALVDSSCVVPDNHPAYAGIRKALTIIYMLRGLR